MRRSGRRFTAGLLAAIMVASSCFSGATTVYAEESTVAQTLEAQSKETSEAEENTVKETTDTQQQESSAEKSEESDSQNQSGETDVKTGNSEHYG